MSKWQRDLPESSRVRLKNKAYEVKKEIFIFHRTGSQIVRLQIISGQNLPKFEKKVIDPYVTVQIMGHPADRHKFKTKPVEDNGTCDTFFE